MLSANSVFAWARAELTAQIDLGSTIGILGFREMPRQPAYWCTLTVDGITPS